MTRTGKIARLPRPIREELNRRLLDGGETGDQLVAWLNSLAEVRTVLTVHFSGRDINEQNLSDWKNGGYDDWLRFQETRDWVRNLVDRSSDLVEDTDQISVADWLSAPLAVALGRCIQEISTASPARWEDRKNLLALARELTQLRRGDHTLQFLRLKRARFEAASASASASSTPNTSPPANSA